MKQWLTIFALICLTAVTQTAERHSRPLRAEFHATVLAPEQDNTPEADSAPLLATSSAARLLHGAQQTPVRLLRNPGMDLTAALHPHASICTTHTAPAIRTALLGDSLSDTHAGDRYIYFLRRIII